MKNSRFQIKILKEATPADYVKLKTEYYFEIR